MSSCEDKQGNKKVMQTRNVGEGVEGGREEDQGLIQELSSCAFLGR